MVMPDWIDLASALSVGLVIVGNMGWELWIAPQYASVWLVLAVAIGFLFCGIYEGYVVRKW